MAMRKGVLLATVVALCLVAAVPAFGVTGFSYVTWDSVKSLPGQGTSPHGGYATSTVKCAVCHAVHGAPLGGELLLASPASEACNYCHVGGAGGYTQVYGGQPSNYSDTDYKNAHNSFYVAGVQQGLTCTTCHQVHAADGAMTANPYLTTKLLRGAKVYNPVTPNYDPIAQAPLSTDSSATALTKWCAGCHFTKSGTYTYYSENYNEQTHVMKTADAAYGNGNATYGGRVAWLDSTYCQSCHASNYGGAEWPHYTAGQRFLVSSTDASTVATAAANSSEDGVCLRCHRQGASNGIGLTF